MMDVFGDAFRDFLRGETAAVIDVKINRELQEELPVSYFFRDYARMPEWERLVLDQCKGRILDVGAGAGAHALVLQSVGLDVTAIDLSSGAVEAMKRRGVKDARCEDYFLFSETGYDAILFLMNGIGLAGSLEGLDRVLEHARRLLSPTGVIYLESTDLIYMYEQEDGSYLIPAGDHYYGDVSYLLTYKKRKASPFAWLFVDPDNLERSAAQNGFSTEMIWHGENHNYVARLALK